MAEIATLKKINLRDVWQDEGQFSDWFAENLSGLDDELGIELGRSGREKAVEPFSADIIWVASRFRDEHRSAIDWLNDISGSETGFFGVVLEAFQISDSAYAPHFDIVARSND